MRKIKFRVWDNGEKIFLEGWRVAQLVIRPLSGRVTDGATTPDVALMQWTGLKDKNGKEIYEGDIVKNGRCGSNQLLHVKWSDAIEEVSSDGVEWTRQKPGFVFEKISKGMTYVFVASKDLEVIGNIYQNPELVDA